MLTARIIAVDIPGIELADPEVVKINQEMESHLSLAGFAPQGDILPESRGHGRRFADQDPGEHQILTLAVTGCPKKNTCFFFKQLDAAGTEHRSLMAIQTITYADFL